MYEVGDNVIYGENGVCRVDAVGPIAMSGTDKNKLYYTLSPVVGTGTFYAPIDTKVFMRSLMSKEEAEEFLDTVADIEPAICNDVRFTHVDAFYKGLFKEHTCSALVAMLKGIYSQERVSKSNRIDAVTKRAKDILNSEISLALEIPYEEAEARIKERLEVN